MDLLSGGIRLRALAVGALVALGRATGLSAQADAPSLEHQVKAAYLFNFTRYVEWPRAAFPADGPLVICVVGDERFGDAMEQAVEGRRSQGRLIQVHRLSGRERAESCHLAFLGADAWRGRRGLIHDLTERGILTVGDTDQFVRSGGVIGFVIANETVRFVVNLHAMERSGLRISSRMLSLAMEFHSTEGPRF